MNLRKALFRLSLVVSWLAFTYLVFLDHTTDASYLKHEIAVFLVVVLLIIMYTRDRRPKEPPGAAGR